MKKILLITIGLFVLSFSSCKKDKEEVSENFTQTDENGNIIGEPNPDHWNLNNFTPVADEDLDIFFNAEWSIEDDLNHQWINLDEYNQNCTTPEFELTVYPNPIDLQETENKIFFNYESNLDIMYHSISLVRNGEIITSSAGYGDFPDYIYPNYGKDLTMYYVILTTDSCAFYGKGDVKFK